ncbi:MAG: RagB/SusD family nutrient uptake outer membrane protein, partial [Ferruginibacter sp.]
MKKHRLLIVLIACCISLSECKKEDSFLNAKPDQALFVPSTLKDLENILNDQNAFNIGDPGLGEIASNDYYLTSDIISNEDIPDRNGYLWAKQLYNVGQNINDWSVPYQQIYYANTILDYLPKIALNSGQQTEANQVRASALFFRATAFYNLVQTFAMPYDANSSTTDLGIPLRLSSDLNIKSVRNTVQQCYEQIINDLETALPLLPVKATYQTLPSQPAANAMLARVFMAMANYSKAFQYADACLNQFNTLTDYNTLNPTPYAINTSLLSEDIFHTSQIGWDDTEPNNVGITDSTLYKSYTANDLRKTV